MNNGFADDSFPVEIEFIADGLKLEAIDRFAVEEFADGGPRGDTAFISEGFLGHAASLQGGFGQLQSRF